MSACIPPCAANKPIHTSHHPTRTISLTSTESDGIEEVELGSASVELYSRSGPSSSSHKSTYTVPSSIPFAIPLTLDTPQCLHAGCSNISHQLKAELITSEPSLPIISRRIAIHTRRFTSHTDAREIAPQTVSLSDPTPVTIQIGRRAYRANEPISVYVTIPPPDRGVILDHGFTLRNVRAELIRNIKHLTTREDGIDALAPTEARGQVEPPLSDISDDSESTLSTVSDDSDARFAELLSGEGSSSIAGPSHTRPLFRLPTTDSPDEIVVAHSGSSCRFHTSRTVKLRLILHSAYPTYSPNGSTIHLPNPEGNFTDGNLQCASISQSTVLHAVEFRVQVRVTYLHVSTRSERTFTTSIPVTIEPPAAPLPESDPSLDSEYMKKHDRPPTKTVRRDDADAYVDEQEMQVGHAGPSALPSGAPPPFDASEAPPPFFSVGEASTSRLPTFFESESEIIMPARDHPAVGSSIVPPAGPVFEGEGELYGFPSSEQYDGHTDELVRSSTPPPSLEMAHADANVTELAGLVDRTTEVIDAMTLVLEEHDDRTQPQPSSELFPPPPPPMDDPSDPPPSIDSEFHSRNPESDPDPPPSILNPDFRTSANAPMGVGSADSGPAPRRPSNSSTRSAVPEPPAVLDVSSGGGQHVSGEASGISPSHAPPPYLNPAASPDAEHVNRPPPYVDFAPPS